MAATIREINKTLDRIDLDQERNEAQIDKLTARVAQTRVY